jgi:hypothetical protein
VDANVVVVLSGANLTKLFKPNVSGIPSDWGSFSVGWSQDGQFLYAGGNWHQSDGKTLIRRWSNGGRGTFVDIPAADNSIMEILPLKAGGVLYTATDAFGLIRLDATTATLQRLGTRLLVSADGRTVQVDSWSPSHTYRFALDRREIDVDPADDGSLVAPVTDAPGLAVTGWRGSQAPAVNGVPLKLNRPYEAARSLAVVPGTQHFVLGTEWYIRMFDQSGNDVWPKSYDAPAATLHVNVADGGRLVVAAFGDGTIRWLRASDGVEILALFIHPDGQRWVAWTPEGYYDASVGGDDLIGWHVNHGYDQAPDFYPASQFRDRFYRPDIIQRVLLTPGLDVADAVREADQAAGHANTQSRPC